MSYSSLPAVDSALRDIEHYEHTHLALAPSPVSADNPHRPLLNAIRNELFHYDADKHARIMFMLNNYLSEHTVEEDPDFHAVLQRVHQVISRFQQTQEILVTPPPPMPPVTRPPRDPDNKPKACRRFNFDDCE